MSQNSLFCRTDLASEWRQEQTDLPEGVRFNEEELDGYRISTLHVDSPYAAALAGRAVGCYKTLELGNCIYFDEEQKTRVSALLSLLIRQAEEKLIEKNSPEETKEDCVLVVGLGNRAMTADAIGPLTVERITVTNHVKSLDPPLFQSLRHRAVAAVSPGVLGQTGIESALTVRQLVGALHPRLVIVVDALAARSTARLCKTVQLSTGGIAPGSGVGNDRPAFTRESLGAPVSCHRRAYGSRFLHPGGGRAESGGHRRSAPCPSFGAGGGQKLFRFAKGGGQRGGVPCRDPCPRHRRGYGRGALTVRARRHGLPMRFSFKITL